MSILSLGLVSCDDDKAKITDPSDEQGWVQFEGASTSAAEGIEQVINIPVELKSVTNTRGTTVSFTAVDVNGNNNGYLTWGNTMTIDKDKLVGYIQVTVHSEVPVVNKVIIDFTLTGTSNNFEVGLSDGSKQVTNRLTVCPNKRDLYLGTYHVIQNSDEDEYNSVVTAGAAPNELVLSRILNGSSSSKTHIFLSNDDYSVTFPAFADNFLFNDLDLGPLYVTGSTVVNEPEDEGGESFINGSTYNPCDLAFDLYIQVAYGDGLSERSPEFHLEMTKL